MTKPDFAATAAERAGDAWATMSEADRANDVRAAKAAWVDERLGGEVDAPTFGAWIRDQPTEVQDEVLGTRRAKALRSGKDIGRYTDHGGTLSLDELEARRPETLTRGPGRAQ